MTLNMFLFILGAILVLSSLVWIVRSLVIPEKSKIETRFGGEPVKKIISPEHRLGRYGYISLLIGLLFVVLSCFSVVGTRNVGVETVFNKPTGDTHGAGLVFKKPWEKITDIDATIQAEEHHGKSCIQVKIADGGTACVSMAYRWCINPDGADKVYMDYRKSDTDITVAVRKALVSTNVKASINEAINRDIKTVLESKISNLGDLIDVQSVTVSYVSLPKSTEKKINAFNQAVQETKIALQQVATKNAQAKGNEALAKSLQDPNVLVAQCLDSLAQGEFVPPAGFSCWPGGSTGVVIPGSR